MVRTETSCYTVLLTIWSESPTGGSSRVAPFGLVSSICIFKLRTDECRRFLCYTVPRFHSFPVRTSTIKLVWKHHTWWVSVVFLLSLNQFNILVVNFINLAISIRVQTLKSIGCRLWLCWHSTHKEREQTGEVEYRRKTKETVKGRLGFQRVALGLTVSSYLLPLLFFYASEHFCVAENSCWIGRRIPSIAFFCLIGLNTSTVFLSFINSFFNWF